MASTLTVYRVAPLLFGSGFCSLVYQVGWLREFRLVFGASTAASAAVLAIFIGGLGVGGLLLGRYADRSTRPLMLYGNLEVAIAASAALSPFLLVGIRHAYIATGGSFALGTALGTLLRLVLAAMVLAIPTVAMGGTLAAATRTVAGASDARRRSLAALYGTNTLGAVVGALASTFFLLEIFGTRKTIWVAALLNALIAIVARGMARSAATTSSTAAATTNASEDRVERQHVESAPPTSPDGPAVPLTFILVASGVVGFAFFLMEMTWYRMLGPILGGTVFTFGLILAIALFGLGVGGLAYVLRPAARAATVYGLILTCLLEAIGLAIPLALGDRIALGASAIRSSAVFGFGGQVMGWAIVAGTVVLPAAIVSGIQFPLLVNLVGRGRANVGHHLGLVYITNTIGAIAGSLLGGFVLLPALGAVGCWRLAALLLVGLGVVALMLVATRTSRAKLVGAFGLIAVAVVLAFSAGPSAAWRHGGIGAGRAQLLLDPNAAARHVSATNRILDWESEGVESSVALVRANGLSFVVNGKVDGNIIADAGTQIMGGIVGALIHPEPRRALVIGLGTGQTAGWLADAPGVEQVDVVELERSILEVANRCASANRDVLRHPEVKIEIGDAREALLVKSDRYDLIFSEPSNPYRAGVASLYTREFYEAARERLGKAGMFLQWTQAYEVDGQTIATIYATLRSVFSEIHTFRLGPDDLLFIASTSPLRIDISQLASRVNDPVIRDALSHAWDVEGVEGFLSHYLGDTRIAEEIAKRAAGDLNTDDRTLIEFAFARSVGMQALQNVVPIRQLATSLGADRPPVVGAIDWSRFEELRAYADGVAGAPRSLMPHLGSEELARIRARAAHRRGNLVAAASAWKAQSSMPTSDYDVLLVAESLAAIGEETEHKRLRPAESALVRARLHATRSQWADAAAALAEGLTAWREDPFVNNGLGGRSLRLAGQVVERDPSQVRPLLEALSRPFALFAMEEERIAVRLRLAASTDDATKVAVLAPLEPHVPWDREVLIMRRDAYAATGHPLLGRAEADLQAFYAGQPVALVGATAEEEPELEPED